MANVIDYGLIESDSQAELAQAVNNALLEGWQPYGGLAVWRDPGSASMYPVGSAGVGGGGSAYPAPPITHYAQALVKYSPWP